MTLDARARRWTHEPPAWRAEARALVVTTAPKTDFWRHTHYGFVRDDGHAWLEERRGGFVATVKVTGAYVAQYDQAGLMVRLDTEHWLKCGVEFVDGVQQASVVVTRGHSDWSVLPLAGAPSAVWFRVARHDDAVAVWYSPDGADFTLLRLAHLPDRGVAELGPMCASPDGDGFTARFDEYDVRATEQPIALHPPA
jgi:uncharacterized protein